MARALFSNEVSDLTLGKPALPWLASSHSVRDALLALKFQSGDILEISVWDFYPVSHPLPPSFHATSSAVASSPGPCTTARRQGVCKCVGKVCMLKIICYLATEESLGDIGKALDAPISVLLNDPQREVQHVDTDASLLEALGLVTAGAQNLVVQTGSSMGKYCRSSWNRESQKAVFGSTPCSNALFPKTPNGREYCWLTQEDVLRFLLGFVGMFSPLSMMSIEELGIIRTDVLTVGVADYAISALEMIKSACLESAAVAVVENVEDSHGAFKLVGEISYSTLQSCNASAALALATLSVGEFLSYVQDCTHSPDAIVDAMQLRIREKLSFSKGRESLQQPISKLGEIDQLFHDLDLSEESSDDEFGAESPTGPQDLSRRWSGNPRAGRMNHYSRSRRGPLFCRPGSSLIAVTVQALAHREYYVWVIKDDETLVGIVTLSAILTVLLNHLESSY